MWLVFRQGQCRRADVLTTVPRLDCPSPRSGQGVEQGKWAHSGRRDGQVDVFERPLEGELRREVAPVHLVQLRFRNRSVQRSALDDPLERRGFDVLQPRLA